MNLSSYLRKRPNSQNWQLRWMVPKAARAALGRSEFTKSLGVTDRRKAETLAFRILTDWKISVDEALKGDVTPPQNAREATLDEIDNYLADRTFDFQRSINYRLAKYRIEEGESTFERERKSISDGHADIKKKLFLDDVDEYLAFTETELRDGGLLLPSTASDRHEVARRTAQAARDALGSVLAEMDGEAENFVPAQFIRKAKTRRASEAAPGETIAELFEKYATQRLAEDRKRQDTVDQDRKIIDGFAEFVGVRRDLRSITPQEAREWRDTIAALPPAFRLRKGYANLTIREAAEKARSEKLKSVSPVTVNKYLSTVSPFFRWARLNVYVDFNPFDGLFYDLQKKKRSRPPFSVDQLNVIFNPPLFVGFQCDGKEHLPGTKLADDWRFWLPIVCLFTGARLGEIAQLRINDIRVQIGLPYLLIRHDETTEQSTKSGYDRPAPIHSKLVAIGFLAFVDRQRKRSATSGNLQLFPELERNARGQISGDCSRFWRGYLTAMKVKTGADGFGSHSFRHTMTDQLRLAGYLDDEIEVVLGHNQKTVTSGYGQIRQGTVERLSTMIESAAFEGVDFTKLLERELPLELTP